jgi:hypothetical protein
VLYDGITSTAPREVEKKQKLYDYESDITQEYMLKCIWNKQEYKDAYVFPYPLSVSVGEKMFNKI